MKKIEGREWTWDEKRSHGQYCRNSEYTYEGKLVWYSDCYPGYAYGAAATQTFEDFLKNGPSVPDVPKKIVQEIRLLLETADSEKPVANCGISRVNLKKSTRPIQNQRDKTPKRKSRELRSHSLQVLRTRRSEKLIWFCICSKIPEKCERYTKGGEIQSNSFPPEADKLVPIGIRNSEETGIKKCPNCGTYYFYSYHYEWYVNGAEEEEELERITKEKATSILKNWHTINVNDAITKELVLLGVTEPVKKMLEEADKKLKSKDTVEKSSAVRTLMEHYVSQSENKEIDKLLEHNDSFIRESAVDFYSNLSKDKKRVERIINFLLIPSLWKLLKGQIRQNSKKQKKMVSGAPKEVIEELYNIAKQIVKRKKPR